MWPQGFLEQSWEITSLVLASVFMCEEEQQPEGNTALPRVTVRRWWSRHSGCGPCPAPAGHCPPRSSRQVKAVPVCWQKRPQAGQGGPSAHAPGTPASSNKVSSGLSRAQVWPAAVVCMCGFLPWEWVQQCRNPRVPASRTAPGCARAVCSGCACVTLFKKNKTGGLCFAWMRGDSAVPGPLREVPREVNVAGLPRGYRPGVHSPVGTPAVGMGCPLPRLLTGLLCTCRLEKQTPYNVGLCFIQQTF